MPVLRFDPEGLKGLEGLGQEPDQWQLSKVVLSSLLKAAEQQNLTINLKNIPGRPFKIVTRPGGGVADWGVGGA